MKCYKCQLLVSVLALNTIVFGSNDQTFTDVELVGSSTATTTTVSTISSANATTLDTCTSFNERSNHSNNTCEAFIDEHSANHSSGSNYYKNMDPVTESPPLSIPFPRMPEHIRAILHEDWDVLDPRGEDMISSLSKIDAAVEFAHASTTFYEHLKGTFGILSAWKQPEVVKRTGLVHTAYSGDLFQFFLFDANKEDDRNQLRDIIGTEAEALTYLFGTVNRGGLCHFKDVVDRVRLHAHCPSDKQTVHHRSTVGKWDVDPVDAANILMVTIADYLDQMVDTNGWRDHHQMEDGGHQLYPGNGRPALGFYWFSSVCYAIKEHLEVIPPVFNYCQDVISFEDEEKARDAYWKVTIQEANLSQEEQIELLQYTISLNHFVAEPHVMLSQIYYRQGRYLESALEARFALEKFYVLAACWDKRRSFGHWVGFARILLLRSNRMMEKEECSFPCVDPDHPLYVNYNQLKLTNLRDVIREMKEREEEALQQ